MLNTAKITATLLLATCGSAFSASLYAENLVATPVAARVASGRSDLPKLGFDSQLIAGYGEHVTFVERGSKAFRLGLEQQDVILSVNGVRLTQREAWDEAIAGAAEDGGSVTLRIRVARTGTIAERRTNLLQY